jgi:hypothetical protein
MDGVISLLVRFRTTHFSSPTLNTFKFAKRTQYCNPQVLNNLDNSLLKIWQLCVAFSRSQSSTVLRNYYRRRDVVGLG